jgi:putative DeoR family transcriptional regulator (stage III sporulation protein D)
MIIIKGDSRERCEILAEYMIENKATVRKTAYRYGVSKSTVHKEVTEKLKKINPALFLEVKIILDTNKAERHIRGGEATKEKYKKVHQSI